MEIGKAYLVHCGDWHTFIGRVTAQLSAYVYVMDHVSKISNTNNNDNWHELAAGNAKARKKATYVHYTTPATIPLTIVAFVWEGLLPQEEMNEYGKK